MNSEHELELDDRTAQAVEYGGLGMHVFPTHAITKEPMRGYAWLDMATTDRDEIIKDFTVAIIEWGADFVSIGWALGRDDCLAVDIDATPEPPWIAEIDKFGAHAKTRRGRHLYFRNPPGLTPGNGVSGFPTHTGFDVRGAGGYVVVAGPDRPGLTIEQYERMQPFPRADWLTSYGGQTNSATSDQVRDFAKLHTASKGPQYLNWLTKAIESQWHPGQEGDPSSGRHPLACEWMAKIADEAQLGYYSFAEATMIVKRWWQSVVPKDRWGREWNGIMSWAVGRALSKSPPTDDPVETEPHESLFDGSTTIQPLSWADVWTYDPDAQDWMVRDLIPRTRSVSITAEAKAGKSDLMLYVAACLAMGRDPWTGSEQRPTRVAYFDYEMTMADVAERMRAYGWGPEHDLDNLRYFLLPPLLPLDTASGAATFLDLVDESMAELVVIDTLMRTIGGDENDAKTFQAFYQLAGMGMKQRQITTVRLDHFGKDKTKGTRGSSAKDADVDVIWSMTKSGRYSRKLVSRSRVSWVPERLDLERWANPHVNWSPRDQVLDNIPSQAAHELMAVMDLLGLPLSWGRDRIASAMVKAGYTPGDNNVLSEAIRLRKLSADRSLDEAVDNDD